MSKLIMGLMGLVIIMLIVHISNCPTCPSCPSTYCPSCPESVHYLDIDYNDTYIRGMYYDGMFYSENISLEMGYRDIDTRTEIKVEADGEYCLDDIKICEYSTQGDRINVDIYELWEVMPEEGYDECWEVPYRLCYYDTFRTSIRLEMNSKVKYNSIYFDVIANKETM